MLNCKSCNLSFENTVSFCSKCGENLTEIKQKEHSKYITRSVFFYLAFIAYIVIYYVAVPDYPSLFQTILFEGSFMGLILFFCLIDLAKILKLFRQIKIDVTILFFLFLFPLASALIASYSMELLNSFLFDEEAENLFWLYSSYSNPYMWAFFFVSFVPAVFEELGFRGYLFNQLLNITSPKVSILITAFLFALMHFSFISFLWIFPFGLVLGYLRYRYKVIWIGMVIHFIHNSIVLLIDIGYYEGFNLYTNCYTLNSFQQFY